MRVLILVAKIYFYRDGDAQPRKRRTEARPGRGSPFLAYQ